MRRPLELMVIVLCATFLGGCGPKLRAVDRRIDFGDTFVGVPVTRSAAWVNHGGEAHIGSVHLSRSDAFRMDASALQRDPELSRNERSGDVEITFDPPKPGTYEARVSLDSNGSEQDVLLRGRGVYSTAPAGLVLSAPGLSGDRALDHGSVPVDGGEAVRRLTVVNRGDRRVVLTPAWARGGQGFTLRESGERYRLNRGEQVELVTVFRPNATGHFQDTLLLTVDDSTRNGGIVVTGRGQR